MSHDELPVHPWRAAIKAAGPCPGPHPVRQAASDHAPKGTKTTISRTALLAVWIGIALIGVGLLTVHLGMSGLDDAVFQL